MINNSSNDNNKGQNKTIRSTFTYLVESAWCKESFFLRFHPIACNVSMSTRAIEGKVWVYGMQSLKKSMQKYGKHSDHLLSTYILL